MLEGPMEIPMKVTLTADHETSQTTDSGTPRQWWMGCFLVLSRRFNWNNRPGSQVGTMNSLVSS